jgi:hypothetical protein
MSKLIEIEPYTPDAFRRHYEDGELAREAAEHTTRKTLEIVETPADRKKREKAEAELAKLEAERQEKVRGLDQMNHLWDQYQRTVANEKRAQEHVQGAQATIEGAKNAIEQCGFDGGHPQLGRDVPAHYSVQVGMQVAGARFVIDEVYPEWTKKNAAKGEGFKAELIALAKKMGLTSELPKEWQ